MRRTTVSPLRLNSARACDVAPPNVCSLARTQTKPARHTILYVCAIALASYRFPCVAHRRRAFYIHIAINQAAVFLRCPMHAVDVILPSGCVHHQAEHHQLTQRSHLNPSSPFIIPRCAASIADEYSNACGVCVSIDGVGRWWVQTLSRSRAKTVQINQRFVHNYIVVEFSRRLTFRILCRYGAIMRLWSKPPLTLRVARFVVSWSIYRLQMPDARRGSPNMSGNANDKVDTASTNNTAVPFRIH